MDIDLSDTMPNRWQVWLDWQKAVAPDYELEIKALKGDPGSVPAMFAWSIAVH
jgi:hypothetical protein